MAQESDPHGPLQRIVRDCPDVTISTDPTLLASHGQDWTRFRDPAPMAVAFPRNTQEVQALVRAATLHRVPLVPSGGRTGLSGGAIAASGELVISLDRMRRILEINKTDRTLTVEAGATVGAVQAFAEQHGLFYPVSFAADGSAQVGGSLATNAGGIRVLRYGMTRDWVAGLEAVDGNGDLLVENAGLVKNASGYDFRHLLVGSEGTLGLIVQATLRLTNPPSAASVMLLALPELEAVMAVFSAFREGVELTAFEFFDAACMAAVRDGHELPEPLESDAPFYVLMEYECPDEAAGEAALACFEACVESGWVVDGALSQSDQQAAALWQYREGISESISPRTPYKNDLSVRPSAVPEFLAALDDVVRRRYPQFEVAWFGHIGDGNLHMNVLRPEGMDVAEFEAACKDVNPEVFDITAKFGGSISAEHGIGLLKRHWLDRTRSAVDIAHMRAIKKVFDPHGILNPGKLLPPED